MLDLRIDGAEGLWHLSNGEPLSCYAFAIRLAERAGLDPRLIAEMPGAALGWVTPRPRFAGLGTERCAAMPPLAAAIDRFVGSWTNGQRKPILARR